MQTMTMQNIQLQQVVLQNLMSNQCAHRQQSYASFEQLDSSMMHDPEFSDESRPYPFKAIDKLQLNMPLQQAIGDRRNPKRGRMRKLQDKANHHDALAKVKTIFKMILFIVRTSHAAKKGPREVSMLLEEAKLQWIKIIKSLDVFQDFTKKMILYSQEGIDFMVFI